MAQTDWTTKENTPIKPKLIGTKAFIDFPIEDVVDYIDWNPFFQACAVPAVPNSLMQIRPHKPIFLLI